MRETKFRLRNRFNKIVGYEKWYEGCWHSDNPDEGFSPTSGYWEAFPCWLYSSDGIFWNTSFINHRYKDSFTGLKDRNGREIYEGDILRFNYRLNRGSEKNTDFFGEVVYDVREIEIGWEHDTTQFVGFILKSKNTDTEYYYCPIPKLDDVEVIGSIYESPELLKVMLLS